MNHTLRAGLTLVEILIAMLVIAVGALGLAASSAALARQMSWNADRFRASTTAVNRVENIVASPCVSSSGTDRSGTVRVNWSAVAGNDRMTVDQTILRTDVRGVHTDVIRGGGRCR